MTIEHKTRLRLLNEYLSLRINYIAVATFEWHGLTTFPVNRLLLILDDGGKDDNIILNRAAHQRLPLKANHIYFIPRELQIELELMPSVSFISFHFRLELFHGFDVFSGCRRCSTVRNAPLVRRIRQMLENEDDLRTLCAIKGHIFELCASFCDASIIDFEKTLMIARRYEPVFTFIRTRGDATTTVAVLAEIAGQQRDVFSRSFSRDLGISPKRFLTRDLVQKAAERLLVPDTTARMVSRQLQFSSEYYFSRFFKRHSGLSPKQFQKQARRQKVSVLTRSAVIGEAHTGQNSNTTN